MTTKIEKFKAGDTVEISMESRNHFFKVGDVGEVMASNPDYCLVKVLSLTQTVPVDQLRLKRKMEVMSDFSKVWDRVKKEGYDEGFKKGRASAVEDLQDFIMEEGEYDDFDGIVMDSF